jgi:hypothetical protein
MTSWDCVCREEEGTYGAWLCDDVKWTESLIEELLIEDIKSMLVLLPTPIPMAPLLCRLELFEFLWILCPG